MKLISNRHISSTSCMKCRYVGCKYMHFMTANTQPKSAVNDRLQNNDRAAHLQTALVPSDHGCHRVAIAHQFHHRPTWAGAYPFVRGHSGEVCSIFSSSCSLSLFAPTFTPLLPMPCFAATSHAKLRTQERKNRLNCSYD
jgi:hypothetical protein